MRRGLAVLAVALSLGGCLADGEPNGRYLVIDINGEIRQQPPHQGEQAQCGRPMGLLSGLDEANRQVVVVHERHDIKSRTWVIVHQSYPILNTSSRCSGAFSMFGAEGDFDLQVAGRDLRIEQQALGVRIDGRFFSEGQEADFPIDGPGTWQEDSRLVGNLTLRVLGRWPVREVVDEGDVRNDTGFLEKMGYWNSDMP